MNIIVNLLIQSLNSASSSLLSEKNVCFGMFLKFSLSEMKEMLSWIDI